MCIILFLFALLSKYKLLSDKMCFETSSFFREPDMC